MSIKSSPRLLSVIIPVYNEASRLGQRLKSVLEFLRSHYPNHELIIVDDGSSDNTAAVVGEIIANHPHARLISYRPNRGKGYAVRTGMLASKGQEVLFMDADLSTPLEEIPHALGLLQNADIVIGSRAQTGAKIHVKPPLYRLLASCLFDQIKFSLVGLRGIKDTQCGFKAFDGLVARRLFSRSVIDRFMFDVEILYLAELADLTIREMPVNWTDAPDSKVRFWEGAVNMFRDLWRIRRIHKQ